MKLNVQGFVCKTEGRKLGKGGGECLLQLSACGFLLAN